MARQSNNSSVIALYTLKEEEKQNVSWREFIRLEGLIMLLQIACGIAFLLLLFWIPELTETGIANLLHQKLVGFLPHPVQLDAGNLTTF